jgi:hypothetical protein
MRKLDHHFNICLLPQFLTRGRNQTNTYVPSFFLINCIKLPNRRKSSNWGTSLRPRHDRQSFRGECRTRVAGRGINTHIVSAAVTCQTEVAGATLRGAGVLLQVSAVIIVEAGIDVLGTEAAVALAAAAAAGVSGAGAIVGARAARFAIGVVDSRGLLDGAGQCGRQGCEHLGAGACMKSRREWELGHVELQADVLGEAGGTDGVIHRN